MNYPIDASATAPSTTQRLVAQYVYDALGNIKEKKIGQKTASGYAPTATPMEDDSYAANIRGWTKGINWSYSAGGATSLESTSTNKWFSVDLSYDWGFNANQYSGNISGQQWANASDGATRAYGYGYDDANRLLFADFNQNFSGTWAKTDPGNNTFNIDFSVQMGTFSGGVSNNDAYDQNGNILKMQQAGFVIGGGTGNLIDKLTYTYLDNGASNRLQNVVDADNNPQTAQGDFRSSQTYLTQLGGTKTATNSPNYSYNDYNYDVNGNLVTDLNKDIAAAAASQATSTGNGITYSYLNLPYQLTVLNEGTITYIYDALGDKIEKRVSETPKSSNGNASIQTTTTYLGAFVYQNNALQYFGMEEGRIRPVVASTYNNNSTYVYDYTLKDHLGNTRITLTDELQEDVYPTLSFEGAGNSDQTVVNQNAIWDNASGQPINVVGVRMSQDSTSPAFGTTTANGSYISSITKPAGAIGAAKLIKVMAGDQLNVSMDWMYSSAIVDNTSANGLNTFANSLAAMVTGSPDVSSAIKGQSAIIAANAGINPNALTLLTPEDGGTDASGQPPKAYVQVICFNDQFVYDRGYTFQIGTNAQNAKQTITQILSVLHSGYAYIYFDNESNTPVYFDNFMLTHVRGPLTQVDNYYAFGLSQAGISSQAAGKLEDKFKYNSKEMQHKEFSDNSGLEWTDYGARMYDQQIGRWFTVDPSANNFSALSPYVYGEDDPIDNIDPDGRFSINNHYDYTYSALTKLGYSKNASDLVSHYASTYADHPNWWIRSGERNYFRSGIDYSPTKNSQDTKSIENSTWHSMKADGENISDQAAMARGQAFGWEKVIDASADIKKDGGIEKLKKNSKGIQELGQGIHALRDAIAHHGEDYAHHHVYDDVYPSDADAEKAQAVASTAVIVTEVLGGNISHLKDGMTLSLDGATQDQQKTILSGFITALVASSSNIKVNFK